MARSLRLAGLRPVFPECQPRPLSRRARLCRFLAFAGILHRKPLPLCYHKLAILSIALSNTQLRAILRILEYYSLYNAALSWFMPSELIHLSIPCFTRSRSSDFLYCKSHLIEGCSKACATLHPLRNRLMIVLELMPMASAHSTTVFVCPRYVIK